MATYTWRATTGGAFDNPANWDLGGVPGSGDSAVLAQYGGSISGTGSVASLSFQSGNWGINDANNGQITGAAASIENGSVDADGNGKLTVNGTLTVGLASNAALTASNGGFVGVTGGATTYVGAATLIVSNRSTMSLGALDLGINGAPSGLVIDAGVLALGGVMLLGSSASSSGSMFVRNGGQAVIAAAGDASAPYLQLGAFAGSTGVAQVSGAGSLLLISSNSAAVGVGGTGSLNVINGGMASFDSNNNGLDPSLVIGQYAGSVGTVGVGGGGSTLAVTGSVVVGKGGSGTLRVVGGASATATSYTAMQAALAVAAGAGGGTLVVDGAGSSFVTSGAAVVGGDNRGAGLIAGGVGQVIVTGGALLQTGAMTILVNSIVTLDASSQETIGGTLSNYGTLSTFGTLSISGVVSGPGTLQIGSGLTSIASLGVANVAFTSATGSLRIASLSGSSTVNGFQIGDLLDLVGTAASLTGTTITTATGTITLGAPPTGRLYAVSSDGNGGTFVTIAADTVGVFRFFDSNYGTHFFSASVSEKNTIIATRPDLVYEGVGLKSVNPASNDPNAAPVYRFFDSTYGTHFFTASASERDTVIKTRSDLLFEGVGFTEHTGQQVNDVAVYRFFDTHYGTHFYTASASEEKMIQQTRADLIYEGIGFYAPAS